MTLLAGFMVPHPPMIVPKVGRGSEAQIEATTRAYEQVAEDIAALAPETIIISSPHTVMYSDYFHISPGKGAVGSFAQFRASSVSFLETYDTELVKEIASLSSAIDFPAGCAGERDSRLDHGTMVPLYFIRQKYTDFKLVRIGLSGLSLPIHYEFGQIIGQAIENTGRKAVYIASGDLSHKLQSYGPYGFVKEGPEYDARVMDVCGRGAFGELLEFDETFCEKASECGHRSFVIMAGAFDGLAVKANRLSHEDVTGVGYGICEFFPEGPSEDRCFLKQFLAKKEQALDEKKAKEDPYVTLARQSVEYYVKHHTAMHLPDDLPEEMEQGRAGVFVSIHEHGKLRGCIGTISPATENIANEIVQNAISACARDPRFDPIEEEELKWLEINVDVLGEPEDIDGPDQLDVKRYGVIVSKGFKRGLLLPDLDGVDTVEQQIAIAKQKAGIGQREPAHLQRFEVIRHE